MASAPDADPIQPEAIVPGPPMGRPQHILPVVEKEDLNIKTELVKSSPPQLSKDVVAKGIESKAFRKVPPKKSVKLKKLT